MSPALDNLLRVQSNDTCDIAAGLLILKRVHKATITLKFDARGEVIVCAEFPEITELPALIKSLRCFLFLGVAL